MKTIIALGAVLITFLTYQPVETKAARYLKYDSLPDSLAKLRRFADSQSIANMDKIQLLEIQIMEAKVLKAKSDSMKKPGLIIRVRRKIKQWCKPHKKAEEYKIIYNKKQKS